MSETMREAVPIIVMYGFVLLLAPFIGFTMWAAFDGDRDHSTTGDIDIELEPELEQPPMASPAASTEQAASTAA